MTTDRTEEGVRVRVKRTSESGTALYGPHKRFGMSWPGFGSKEGWLVPVRYDRAAMGVELFTPSDLEPGPPCQVESPLGDRRVRSKADRRLVGTLLPGGTVGGVNWPGFDRSGRLRVPVSLDDGTMLSWRVEDMEQAPPEPEPAPRRRNIGLGPRVMVRDGRWEAPRPGHVLYHVAVPGRSWPGFDVAGQWRVPVLMDLSGSTLFIPATDLEPYIESEPVEATILAEADRLANAIQTKALRDVAEAAAHALDMFADRLRAIAREEGAGHE